MYLHCVYKFCIRCDIYCPGSIAGATKKQWLEGKSSNHCFKKTLWTGQGPIHSISYYNYIPFALYCNCSLISHVSTFILSETGFPKTLTGDTRQSFYRYFPKNYRGGEKFFLFAPHFLRQSALPTHTYVRVRVCVALTWHHISCKYELSASSEHCR